MASGVSSDYGSSGSLLVNCHQMGLSKGAQENVLSTRIFSRVAMYNLGRCVHLSMLDREV